MKRVKFACLAQTIHFELNEKLEHPEAVQQAQESLRALQAGAGAEAGRLRGGQRVRSGGRHASVGDPQAV